VTFGTLALIVAVGLAGPLLARLPTRFAPPIVIGEIAAGVVIGRTGTGTIDPSQPTLAFLAAIGFALLMFIVGTHLPMRERRLLQAAGRGTVTSVATLAVAIALAPVIAALAGLHRPGILVVLVAASSAAVVLPITEQAAPSNTLLTVVAWVSILDVVTVLAVPLVLATGTVARAVIGMVLVILGAAAVGIFGSRAGRLGAVERIRRESHQRGWALDLRLSLLVLFTLAWIAERFNTSVLVAGFAAGAMVAAVGPPRRVADQLIGLGEGFFVPLFFVVLGAGLDLRALAHSGDDIWLLVLLAAASAVAHVVAAAVTKLPVSFGLLASAQIGVPAAVASIGLSTHALRPGQAAAIVGAAVVSLVVASGGAAWCDLSPPPNAPPPS
jgi:Kef-type K+ transport system membrane component KefB